MSSPGWRVMRRDEEDTTELAKALHEDHGNGTLSAHAILAKLSWAYLSHPGVVRSGNEDFVGVYAPTIPDDAWDRGALFVVADGMGGHAAGEVASRSAVESLLEAWRDGPARPGLSDLRRAFRVANERVLARAATESGRRGMGTTLTALALTGTDALVGHVGDSRAYLLRDGEVVQLTADHTVVGELRRRRLVSDDQARQHPDRSVLTRAIGADLMVNVDLERLTIRRGDRFLLCSDGLWSLLETEELASRLARAGSPNMPAVTEGIEALVAVCLERGAPDNVTALLVEVTSDRPIAAGPPARRRLPWGRRSSPFTMP